MKVPNFQQRRSLKKTRKDGQAVLTRHQEPVGANMSRGMDQGAEVRKQKVAFFLNWLKDRLAEEEVHEATILLEDILATVLDKIDIGEEDMEITNQEEDAFTIDDETVFIPTISADNGPNACTQCGKQYKNKTHLQRHELTHMSDAFICKECAEEFEDKYKYANHLIKSSCHLGMKFPCQYCPKILSRKDKLTAHIKTKHPEGSPVLKSKIGNLTITKVENQNVPETETYQSIGFQCDNEFNYQSPYDNEYKSKVGNLTIEKVKTQNVIETDPDQLSEFQSPNGDEYRPKVGNLTIEKVENQNMLVNEEDQASVSSFDKEFNPTVTIEKVEYPITEPYQSRIFPSNDEKISKLTIERVENHNASKVEQSNEFPYANEYNCTKCPKLFRNSKLLYRHTSSVHSEVPITCYECGKTFSRKDKLNTHTRKQHNFSSFDVHAEPV